MPLRTPSRLLLVVAFVAGTPAFSQQDPAIPPVVTARRRPAPRVGGTPANLNLVLLDPAHGGTDPGARLGPNLLEKDVTLAFSNRLRAILTARGFTVVSTRETEADNASSDERVDLANRSHPLACLLLHASAAGHGIHLYASALLPQARPASATDAGAVASAPIASWDSLQAASLPQSLRLSTDLDHSLHNLRLPLLTGRSSPAPLDALACPAVALELAPYAAGADAQNQTSPADDSYQQHVAESVATALALFRTQMQPAVAPPSTAAPAGKPAPAKPKAAPVRKPVPNPGSTTP